ncbi:hypothetical protein G4B88_017230 [Cannabis sativa]|uniref:FLZ-type domain-containing protein n=1 Tax=Cannabis sativa TaxID=3483 RepID=A0A7J6G0G5_CANSA|nr:hypothetical protein G4B88_017230 [Cannabis sativa]
MVSLRAKRARKLRSATFFGDDDDEETARKRGLFMPTTDDDVHSSIEGVDSNLADENTSKHSSAHVVTSDSATSSLSQPSQPQPPPSSESRPIMMIEPLEVVTRDGAGYKEKGDYFLDKCSYCKKELDKRDHTFMYRNFAAFCTPLCRQKVMDNDEEFKKEFQHFRETVLKDNKNWGGMRDGVTVA